jgi:hypothetical protein
MILIPIAIVLITIIAVMAINRPKPHPATQGGVLLGASLAL